jgi:hypothetical protein
MEFKRIDPGVLKGVLLIADFEGDVDPKRMLLLFG